VMSGACVRSTQNVWLCGKPVSRADGRVLPNPASVTQCHSDDRHSLGSAFDPAPANLAVRSSECFTVAPGDATIPWLGCSGSSVARAVADVRGRAIAGVAAGSPMWVEEGDRQFRALDVGVMAEAGERDRWDAQPG
jgi:hypothetical protein